MDFEFGDSLSNTCTIKFSEINDKIHQFFPENSNELKQLRDYEKYLKQLINADMVFEIKNENISNPNEKRFEVKRIIKEKVSIEELKDFKEKLENGDNIKDDN